MKRLFLIGLCALATGANAQWLGSTLPTGPIYRLGAVGIGSPLTPNINTGLHLQSTPTVPGTFLIEGSNGIVPVSGAGTRLMWIPELGAFRAGTVFGPQWDAANVGTASWAGGRGNTASGLASMSMGVNNSATAQSAFAVGDVNTADGQASIAMGNNCVTTATAPYSFAAGNGSKAWDEGSFALGKSNNSYGIGSFSMGQFNSAGGEYAFALGTNTLANADNSFAQGMFTSSTANASFCLGSGAFVSSVWTPLVNNIPNSMMVGFGSNKSTLFVSEAVNTSMWGKVGIGTTNPGAFLDVKFPFACGQWHSGLYNAVFDASSGAWDNVVAINGSGPIGQEGVGCGDGGWNGAYIVKHKDQTGTITETARIFANGNAVLAGNFISSDRNLKSNILPLLHPIETLRRLQGVSYDFQLIKGESNKIHSLGFIAQDVAEVIPEIVHKDGEGRYALNYDAIIPLLTEAIKEQQKHIEELEKKAAGVQPLPGTPDNGFGSSIPVDGIRLMQNTPNPFTLETRIGYFLPEQIVQARMIIYDLQGKQIKSYTLDRKGDAELVIRGSELQAGMYVYSLIADGKVIDTKRMILTEE